MIIVRPSQQSMITQAAWVMVYGRRKTGKSFLCRQHVKYDEYYFVKRDITILGSDGVEEVSYDTFVRLMTRDLEQGRTIVVDEFHRLGQRFLDQVHALPQNGRLILVSSTLHLSKELLSSSSPILGKFAEARIDIIDLADVINSCSDIWTEPRTLMERSIFLREPLMVNFGKDWNLGRVLSGLMLTVPALVGEIFTEEDRKLSTVYEGIIRATAVGKTTSSEISSFLFSRNLIKKDDPSIIQSYLNNLCGLGVLKKVPVWKKNRMVYRHVSPLTRLYYYLDEKYAVSDREVPIKQMERFIDQQLPFIVEQNVQEAVASKLGMALNLHHHPSEEVDGVLVGFKKAVGVLEVKWKDTLDDRELESVRERLEEFPAKRKILFVPDKEGVEVEGVEVWDVRDLV